MGYKWTNNKKTVCVFDSGIGGINLLVECATRMPDVSLVYVADNNNVPYGNLPHEKIMQLVTKAFETIKSFDPCAVLVACNTVTAECIESLRATYAFPIVGIQPAVRQAAAAGDRCLVLATCATVKSQSFRQLVNKYAPPHTTICPCPDLANYIEQNIYNLPNRLDDSLIPLHTTKNNQKVKNVDKLKNENFKYDSVVLGCTHYAFIKNVISEMFNCTVYDGIAGTVDHLLKIIGINNHFVTTPPKVLFIGGIPDRNCHIYENLVLKLGKYN